MEVELELWKSASTLRIEDYATVGPIPHYADSFAIVAISSNSAIKTQTLTGTDYHHPKEEEPSGPEPSGLDLSLKLEILNFSLFQFR